ncbi:MAG: mannose-6-phosphate isomerase [Neolewinella sp.]|jgi:mannose-6-phosphate isomerase
MKIPPSLSPLAMSPIRLTQKPIPKVWGGRNLKSMFGFELPPGEEVGESWLLYDRPDGSSKSTDGTCDLASLMKLHARAILGKGVAPGFGGKFPLMLKLIDAREQLSLQVHPDDEQARSEGDGGKHEACIVLRAGPDARMVSGLRPGVTREQFLAAVHNSDFESVVQSFSPRAGDCFDVPAGTVHAIGPDVLIFEVEQNSDVTYRFHDWGRERPVQAEKAASVARTEVQERPVQGAKAMPGGGYLLTENPWFRVRRYQSASSWNMVTSERFLTITVISGGGTLHWEGSDGPGAITVLPGDTFLVPACLSGVTLCPDVSLDVIACDPGRQSSCNSVRVAS